MELLILWLLAGLIVLWWILGLARSLLSAPLSQRRGRRPRRLQPAKVVELFGSVPGGKFPGEGPIRQVSIVHIDESRLAMNVDDHTVTVDIPAGSSAGAGPTPTELFVGALGASAAYYARRALHNADGLKVTCNYEMSANLPRRISRVRLDVRLPKETSADAVRVVERAVRRCVVKNSLDQVPDVQMSVAPTPAAEPGEELSLPLTTP
jgi:uncharacterized OsmC-like protein